MKTVSPYLSAEALGLKEGHKLALVGLAADLSNHRIPDDEWKFQSWNSCVCGHLQRRTGVQDKRDFGEKIFVLFTVGGLQTRIPGSVSQEQAGRAAFNYLTIGNPRWDEILSA